MVRACAFSTGANGSRLPVVMSKARMFDRFTSWACPGEVPGGRALEKLPTA